MGSSVGFAVVLSVSASMAQNAPVDPERLIGEQEQPAAPGRLLDNLFTGLPNARERLRQDYGIRYAANYYAGVYTQLDGDGESASGLANLAVRWDAIGRGSPNMGSIIAYVENRHELGGNTSTDFNRRLGPAISPNAFNSAGGFTRLRQLYYRQSLFENELIAAFGKFALRGNFSYSPLTANRFRSFQSAALSLAPTAPWPADSVGVYARWQPAGERWGATTALVDAAPDINGFDFDIEGPYALTSLYLVSEPWRPDSGRPPPSHHFQATVYRQPDTAGRAEGLGTVATYDLRLRPMWSVGLRYGYADEDLGAVQQNAAAALVFDAPFERASDGAGIGVAWSREAVSEQDVFTAEAFYRWNVVPGFELTPTLQFTSTDDDGGQVVFGLRSATSF